MRADLGILDVIIVVSYVLGSTFVGLWFSGKQTGLGRYFLGDRNLSWWLVLGSIVATETSTVTFLSVPGVAFNREGGNFTFLQLPLGYLIGRILVAWIILPGYFRGEIVSAYQILHQQFDSSVQRAASGLFLLTRTIADGLRLYLTALLLGEFTGWNDAAAILVIGTLTILYTYLGGMQAVVWTDLIQLLIYLTGAVVSLFFILRLIDGGWSGYVHTSTECGKFVWLDTSWNPRSAYTLWAGVIGGAFFSMASHGADQLMVQRFLSSRSLGEARLALISSGVAVFAQFLLFLLIGAGLFVLWQQGTLEVPTDRRNDEVFGLFIVKFLPQGLVGLVVAAVLAAAMSTLSSSLNSSAGAFLVDFYRPMRPNHPEGHYLGISKTMTGVFGVLQMAVALITLFAGNQRSVVDQVLTVASFTTGLVLALFLLGLMPMKVSSRSALTGLAVGFLAVCVVWVPWNDNRALLAWPWYAPVGTVTTVATALLLRR